MKKMRKPWAESHLFPAPVAHFPELVVERTGNMDHYQLPFSGTFTESQMWRFDDRDKGIYWEVFKGDRVVAVVLP